jgi:hypothetical protein
LKVKEVGVGGKDNLMSANKWNLSISLKTHPHSSTSANCPAEVSLSMTRNSDENKRRLHKLRG